jgi:hypothetical protein
MILAYSMIAITEENKQDKSPNKEMKKNIRFEIRSIILLIHMKEPINVAKTALRTRHDNNDAAMSCPFEVIFPFWQSKTIFAIAPRNLATISQNIPLTGMLRSDTRDCFLMKKVNF